MIRPAKSWLTLILFLFFFLTIQVCIAWPFDFLFNTISVGDLAPDFTLEDLSGQEVTLSALKGTPIILFFWTSWCPHCRHQLSLLAKDYLKIKKSKIEILTINIKESKYKVSAFLKRYNSKFKTLLDRTGRVANLYDVEGVPTFYFISKSGKIIYISNLLPTNYIEKFVEAKE